MISSRTAPYLLLELEQNRYLFGALLGAEPLPIWFMTWSRTAACLVNDLEQYRCLFGE
jgi:hypothetical protein